MLSREAVELPSLGSIWHLGNDLVVNNAVLSDEQCGWNSVISEFYSNLRNSVSILSQK